MNYRLMKLDKIRILARSFYMDNRDQWDSYADAFKELSEEGNLTDAFIDNFIRITLPYRPGHHYYINDLGQVVLFRLRDEYVEFVTEFTEAEAELLRRRQNDLLEKDPYMRASEVFALTGYRLIQAAQ